MSPHPSMWIVWCFILQASVAIPPSLAQTEQPQRHDWLKMAKNAAARVAAPDERAELYADVAVELAQRGDLDRYRETIATAATAASLVTDWGHEADPVPSARAEAGGYLMPGLIEAGRIEEAVRMTEQVAGVSEYYLNAAGSHLVRTLTRHGHSERALAVAEELGLADEKVNAAVARGMADAGRIKKALTLAEKLSEFQRHRLLGKMAAGMIRRGQLEKAEDIIRRIPRDASVGRNEALRALLRARIERGEFERAKAVADRMRHDSRQRRAYEKIAAAQAAAGEYEAAYATVEAMPMPDRLDTNVGSMAVEDRWDALVKIGKAQAERGDYAAARRTIKMIDKDLHGKYMRDAKEPRNRIRITIAQAQLQSGDLEAAKRTLLQVPKDVESYTYLRDKLLKKMAATLARQGRATAARKMAEQISPQPRDILLDAAHVLAEAGEKQPALALLDQRERAPKGQRPPSLFRLDEDPAEGDQRARFLRDKIQNGEAAATKEAIRRLRDRMKQAPLRAAREQTGLKLLTLYLRAGRIDDAEAFAKKLPKFGFEIGGTSDPLAVAAAAVLMGAQGDEFDRRAAERLLDRLPQKTRDALAPLLAGRHAEHRKDERAAARIERITAPAARARAALDMAARQRLKKEADGESAE